MRNIGKEARFPVEGVRRLRSKMTRCSHKEVTGPHGFEVTDQSPDRRMFP
jgi:hypothetical protein